MFNNNIYGNTYQSKPFLMPPFHQSKQDPGMVNANNRNMNNLNFNSPLVSSGVFNGPYANSSKFGEKDKMFNPHPTGNNYQTSNYWSNTIGNGQMQLNSSHPKVLNFPDNLSRCNDVLRDLFENKDEWYIKPFLNGSFDIQNIEYKARYFL